MRILSVSDYAEPMLYEPGAYKSFSGIDLILSCGDLPYDLKPPQGCVDLHGKIIVYKDVRIMGLEGSHWYNGGQLQYTEKQMARMVMKTKFKIWWHRGVDMIISHAPPRHVHDGKDPCHRGFKCFRGLINRYSPKYFLHGHIHIYFKNKKERKTVINKTDVINTFGYHVFDYIK